MWHSAHYITLDQMDLPLDSSHSNPRYGRHCGERAHVVQWIEYMIRTKETWVQLSPQRLGRNSLAEVAMINSSLNISPIHWKWFFFSLAVHWKWFFWQKDRESQVQVKSHIGKSGFNYEFQCSDFMTNSHVESLFHWRKLLSRIPLYSAKPKNGLPEKCELLFLQASRSGLSFCVCQKRHSTTNKYMK